MLAEAKRCYLEAIRIRPTFSIAWSNLAGIFKEEVRGDVRFYTAYWERQHYAKLAVVVNIQHPGDIIPSPPPLGAIWSIAANVPYVAGKDGTYYYNNISWEICVFFFFFFFFFFLALPLFAATACAQLRAESSGDESQPSPGKVLDSLHHPIAYILCCSSRVPKAEGMD